MFQIRKLHKKGISPLIASILIIVVAVVLIAVVLTWGKTFTQDSLEDVSTNLLDLKPSEAAFYLTIDKGLNGRFFAHFNPPQNTFKEITVTGYSYLDIPRVPLEPAVTIKPHSTTALDLGIVNTPFDLVLYLEDGTIITKKDQKTENRSPTDCPEGFIPVPGNFLYDTTYGNSMGFCVAKYEMKASKTGPNGKGVNVADYPGRTTTYNTWYYSEDSDINFVSSAEGSPITYITQLKSIAACESIGGHLITNDEWMTIARNIEMVPSNWSGGEVGNGYLPRGNSNSSGAKDGFDELLGINKRTLTLTNGEVIWDLAGNVWEWNDNTIQRKDMPDIFNYSDDSEFNGGLVPIPYTTSYSKKVGYNWYLKSNDLGVTTLQYKDLFLLTNDKYNTNQGVGIIYYIFSDRNSTDNSFRVFLRGGHWSNSSNAGVLALYLSHSSALQYNYIGLRCSVVR